MGLSGTGKSSVGRLLARKLRWRFIDTDSEIERQEKRRISQIFQDQGEEYFRELERRVVREICAQRHYVVSTGGGAVLDPENRSAMRAGNLVIWLRATPETLLDRLKWSVHTRPLLKAPDPLGRIRAMAAERHQDYSQASHVSVHTDGKSHEAAADLLWNQVQAWKKPS
ncbi:MAG: shikimate kinase [Chloroflexota bacterium]|nr:shikimate kinase [Chloroflexota bacterium]